MYFLKAKLHLKKLVILCLSSKFPSCPCTVRNSAGTICWCQPWSTNTFACCATRMSLMATSLLRGTYTGKTIRGPVNTPFQRPPRHGNAGLFQEPFRPHRHRQRIHHRRHLPPCQHRQLPPCQHQQSQRRQLLPCQDQQSQLQQLPPCQHHQALAARSSLERSQRSWLHTSQIAYH